MPSLPIERGKPRPGLLAHVLVAKYADHLPLYRQSGIYAREGVELERSTLADWVGRATALLDPLTQALRKDVLASDILHGDDTPVPVLAPGLGKAKTGRLYGLMSAMAGPTVQIHRLPQPSSIRLTARACPREGGGRASAIPHESL